MRYLRILPVLLAALLLLSSCSAAGHGEDRGVLLAVGKGNIEAVTLQAVSDENYPSVVKDVPSGSYIVNINTMVIHTDSSCSSVQTMSEKNKKVIEPVEAERYIENGYHYCSRCSGR